MACGNWLTVLSYRVNHFLEKVYQRYGAFCYNRPWFILLISLITLFSLAYGFSLYEEELDSHSLWVPYGAQSVKDRNKINKVFEVHAEPEFVYVVGKPEGANLLTPEAFQELVEFELGFWDSVRVDGKTYNDVCQRSQENQTGNESSCKTTDYPFQFFLKEDGSFDDTMLADLVEEINDGRGTADFYPEETVSYISIDTMFGGTTPPDAVSDPNDGTNTLQEAEAIQWLFYISKDGVSIHFIREFETKYEEYLEEFNKRSEYISVHAIMSSSIARESQVAADRDLNLIVVGIILIVLHSLFVLGELSTYRSRMLIAIAGIISIGIAYVEAISLGALCGVTGNGVINLVPFLMVGIGVDDMYVLISALKQAPRESSGSEMMEHMMKHAGLSITITSLTNFGAFSIGSITTIPAIRNFCIYAALGILFDYFNQLTFFTALLAYDIRRSEKLKGDCCGLMFCKPHSPVCCGGRYIFDYFGDVQRHCSEWFMEAVYGKVLMLTPVRVFVCLFFAGFLGLNIYGVSQLELEFDYEWFVNEDFRVYSGIQIRETYFPISGIPIDFYSLHSDFTSQEVQAQLDTLAQHIDTCKGCERDWVLQGTTDSWYSMFKLWVGNGNCVDSNNSIVALSEGYVPSPEFHECLQQFEAAEDGSLYSRVLVWEDTVLVGSVIEANMINPPNAADSVQILSDTRDIAEAGPDDTYPYNGAYPWYEHNAVFGQEATLQICSALLAVFLIALVTSANFLRAFLVVLVVGFTAIGQLATVYFWGEHLNIVTITYSIMGIGTAVDYSAHFAHTFISTYGMDKRSKVRNTLGTIGVGIFNGGFSTFLAILPTAGAETYVFKVFFKCWFSIVLYGLAYSLILLPVVFSILTVGSSIEFDEKQVSPARTEKPIEPSRIEPEDLQGLSQNSERLDHSIEINKE